MSAGPKGWLLLAKGSCYRHWLSFCSAGRLGIIIALTEPALPICLLACRVLCLAYRDIHLPAEALQPAGEWAGDGGSLTAALGSGSESDASLHAWDDCLCLADNLESNLTLVGFGAQQCPHAHATPQLSCIFSACSSSFPSSLPLILLLLRRRPPCCCRSWRWWGLRTRCALRCPLPSSSARHRASP